MKRTLVAAMPFSAGVASPALAQYTLYTLAYGCGSYAGVTLVGNSLYGTTYDGGTNGAVVNQIIEYRQPLSAIAGCYAYQYSSQGDPYED